MSLKKLITNQIGKAWKDTFNGNVDELVMYFQNLKREDEALQKRISNLVLKSGGDSPTEVADARTDSQGNVYDTLYERLAATDNQSLERFQELQMQIAVNQAEIRRIGELILSFIGTVNDTIDIYVSAERGTDNGDGSETNPHKTIQQAVNAIPIISASRYIVWIESGAYLEDVVIDSRRVKDISLRSVNYTTVNSTEGDTDVFLRSVTVNNTDNYVLINGLTFIDQANTGASHGTTKAAVSYDLSKYVSIQNCRFAENTKALGSGYSAIIGGSTTVSIGSRTYFSDQSYCISSRAGSQVLISGNISGANNNVGYYANQAVIRVVSSATLQATTIKSEVYGGQVLGLG